MPALLLFGLFFLVPLGLIVAYSFWETVDYNVVHHWTLDNYRYFFSVSTYVSTMWATIWVSVARDGDHDRRSRSRSPTGSCATCGRACSGSCSCS